MTTAAEDVEDACDFMEDEQQTQEGTEPNNSDGAEFVENEKEADPDAF